MSESSTMSVKDWLITLIITALPIVGFIMLFVWAFSSGTPTVKANWAKAALLLFAIMIVLYIIFGVVIFGAVLGGAASSGAFDSY